MPNLKKFFRRHAFRFYDPALEQLQHALQTTLSATIAIILTLIFKWPQNSWLILAAVFILQITPTRSLTQKIYLQAATGIIGTLIVLIAWQTKKILVFKIIMISFVGFCMVIVGVAGPQFALAGFFVVVWTILAYNSKMSHPYEHAILLLAGTGIAIIVGLLPLIPARYRLRQIKINFWRACSHYWQERILTAPNPLHCHNYRLHLLTCLDKLNQMLPAEQSQVYAFCFELICDVLLYRDNLVANYHDSLHSEIKNVSQIITKTLSLQYYPPASSILNLVQSQLGAHPHLSDIAIKQFNMWIQNVDRLAQQIHEVRKNDIA